MSLWDNNAFPHVQYRDGRDRINRFPLQ